MQKSVGDPDRTVHIVASLELAMMAVTGLADMLDNGIEKAPRLAVLVSFLAGGVLFTVTRTLLNYPRNQSTALNNPKIEE